MDIKDFEGLTKFKLIIPFIYIVNWALMFVGPSFFPIVYQKICICLLVYLLFKLCTYFFNILIILFRSWKYMNRLKDSEANNQYKSLTHITD